jgi:hypothetical protein
MSLGLLLAIARLLQLPLTHSTRIGAIREGRSRQVVLWAGARARHIVGMDKVPEAGIPGETGLILFGVLDAVR